MTTRIDRIGARLEKLQPIEVEITDQSHLHVGHAGARDGRGHFHLKIISEQFEGRNPVQRHRLIYEAIGDLMESDIHALGIEALTRAEATNEETQR